MIILNELHSSNRLKLILLATPIIVGSGYCLYYYYNHYYNNKKSINSNDDNSNKKKNDSSSKESIKDPIKAQLIEAIDCKNRGNDLFRSKNYEEALKMYTEAIQLCPPDRRKEMSTFYQNRAACHEHLKQYDSIIQDCTKAIENDRQYVKAYLRRGKAYETLKNYDDACYDYYIATDISQYQNSEYMTLLGECLAKYAKKRAEQIISKRNEYTFQKYLFKHLLNKFARDPLKKREKEILTDDYDSIIKQLLQADDDNLNEDDMLLKGTIEMYIGKHDHGKILLEKIIDTSQNVDYKVNSLLKLAEHSLQNLKLDECENYIEKALALDSDNPDIYYVKSQLLIVQKNYPESINVLKKSIELDPSFVIAIGQRLYIKYQQCIMNNNQLAKGQVLKDFETQIEKFPDCNELLLLYFQILLSESENDKATEIIEQSLKNFPDDPTLYVYRSLIEGKENSIEKTKEYLDKALELDPRCSFAYEMLSDLYIKMRDFTRGIDCLERAVNSSTTFEDIKNLLISQKTLKMQLQYQSQQA